MTLVKRNAFTDQSVQIGRVHMLIAQTSDCVVTLLIRDDKDDIRAIIVGNRLVDEHGRLSTCWCVWSLNGVGFRTGAIDFNGETQHKQLADSKYTNGSARAAVIFAHDQFERPSGLPWISARNELRNQPTRAHLLGVSKLDKYHC